MEVTALGVFIAALITDLACGLGALPFFFTKSFSRRWLSPATAVASGLMIAASFGLIYEGLDYSAFATSIGALVGLGFIVVSRKVLGQRHEGVLGMDKASGTKALMFIGVMTIHSATEGIAQGVAFGGGERLGIWVAVALSVHNVAEGLAVSLVLIPRGVRVWVAALWAIFTSIPQPVLAPPAFLAVEVIRPLLPIGLGFAAGAMLWMVFCELLPDALKEGSANTVAIAAVISTIAMTTFQAVI